VCAGLSLSLSFARTRTGHGDEERDRRRVRARTLCARTRAGTVPIMDMQAAKQVPFIHVQSALVAYPFTISHLPFTILLSGCCTCCPSPLFLILPARRPIAAHSPSGTPLELLFRRTESRRCGSIRFRETFGSVEARSPPFWRKGGRRGGLARRRSKRKR